MTSAPATPIAERAQERPVPKDASCAPLADFGAGSNTQEKP